MYYSTLKLLIPKIVCSYSGAPCDCVIPAISDTTLVTIQTKESRAILDLWLPLDYNERLD